MVVAFSLACKDFGRQFYHSFPACAFIYLDSFKVEISSWTPIPPFRPGSVKLRWLWLSVPWRVVCELVLLTGSHTMPGQQHSQPTDFIGSRVYTSLGVTCHLHFLAKWLGPIRWHCGNTGVEGTPNKSQHTKFTLEKKILPPLLLGLTLTTFWSQVPYSTNKLSRLHRIACTYWHYSHEGRVTIDHHFNLSFNYELTKSNHQLALLLNQLSMKKVISDCHFTQLITLWLISTTYLNLWEFLKKNISHMHEEEKKSLHA